MDDSGPAEAIVDAISAADLVSLVPYLILALAMLAVDELAKLDFSAGLDLAYLAAVSFFLYGLFAERSTNLNTAQDRPGDPATERDGPYDQSSSGYTPQLAPSSPDGDPDTTGRTGQSARGPFFRVAALIAAIGGALAIGVALGSTRRRRNEQHEQSGSESGG